MLMSKMEDVKGVLKTFYELSKEEFDMMDRKLLRIGVGIISFLVAAVFWYFIFNGFSGF